MTNSSDVPLGSTLQQTRFISDHEFDREALLRENDLSEEQFSALGLSWVDLEEIANKHEANRPYLETIGNSIVPLLQHVKAVHSLRMRVKDSTHLVSKIIRKRKEQPSRIITVENYQKEITDLIGVRVLHLTRERWEDIHDFIEGTWKPHKKPVAYLRVGDLTEWAERYRAKKCKVERRSSHYRSVHYIVKVAPTMHEQFVEIQVRTIFDEAWGELDHELRYPTGSQDPLLVWLLSLLNRYTGAADELSSFIVAWWNAQVQIARELAAQAKEYEELQASYDEVVDRLKVDEAQKTELLRLRAQLDEVNRPRSGATARDIANTIERFAAWSAGEHPILEALQKIQGTTVPSQSSVSELARNMAEANRQVTLDFMKTINSPVSEINPRLLASASHRPPVKPKSAPAKVLGQAQPGGEEGVEEAPTLGGTAEQKQDLVPVQGLEPNSLISAEMKQIPQSLREPNSTKRRSTKRLTEPKLEEGNAPPAE